MTSRADSKVKQDQARTLRLSGMTWQEVADSPDPTTGDIGEYRPLYASPSAAQIGARAADERARGGKEPTPNEKRGILNDRYELLTYTWMNKAMEGDDVAAGIVLRAWRQQAQLHGLNLRAPAAERERSEGKVDPVDDVARKRAARQRAVRGATTPGSLPAT